MVKQKTISQTALEEASIIQTRYRSDTLLWVVFSVLITIVIVGTFAFVLHQAVIQKIETEYESQIEKLESQVEKSKLEEELKDVKEEMKEKTKDTEQIPQ